MFRALTSTRAVCLFTLLTAVGCGSDKSGGTHNRLEPDAGPDAGDVTDQTSDGTTVVPTDDTSGQQDTTDPTTIDPTDDTWTDWEPSDGGAADAGDAAAGDAGDAGPDADGTDWGGGGGDTTELTDTTDTWTWPGGDTSTETTETTDETTETTDETDTSPGDGGPGPDGGSPVDSGIDGGAETDGGTETDGGVEIDGGVEADGGAAADGGDGGAAPDGDGGGEEPLPACTEAYVNSVIQERVDALLVELQGSVACMAERDGEGPWNMEYVACGEADCANGAVGCDVSMEQLTADYDPMSQVIAGGYDAAISGNLSWSNQFNPDASCSARMGLSGVQFSANLAVDDSGEVPEVVVTMLTILPGTLDLSCAEQEFQAITLLEEQLAETVGAGIETSVATVLDEAVAGPVDCE